MELDCINGLNSDNEIYPKLGHHLTRIYETDFKDLNDEERIILLQSLMRVGGKVGPS